MPVKRPLIFLLIAVGLAAAILLIEHPQAPRIDDVGGDLLVPGFDTKDVARVEITQLLEGVALTRDGDRWKVSATASPLQSQLDAKERLARKPERRLRADRTRVMSSLGIFSGLGAGVLVSENPKNRSLYQVDAAGLRVRLLDAEHTPLIDIVIGKNGPDFSSTFVRRFESDDVVLVNRSLTGIFSPVVEDWRERKIWVLEPSTIASLSIASDGRTVRIEQDADGRWKHSSETTEETGDVDIDVIHKLSDVRAAGFTDVPSGDARTSLLTIKVIPKEGKEFSLDIFPANAQGQYPAKLKNDDEWYILSPDVVDAAQQLI